MANIVSITFGVLNKSFPAMILDADYVQSETITSSASNQQSAAAPATFNGPLVANIVTDTAIYVAAATNPNCLTTEAAKRKMIPAGGDVYVQVKAGHKIAVVNA